jgi:hypothetical protein
MGICNDHQVEVRGLRIELDEIEARPAEHPAIARRCWRARTMTATSGWWLMWRQSGDAAETTPPERAASLRAHLATQLPLLLLETIADDDGCTSLEPILFSGMLTSK